MTENDYIEAIYPLSPIQQGMLFHSLLAPGSGVYIQQNTFILNENMNLDAFKSALQELIQRHPILRTLFRWERDGEPIQIVVKKVPLPITYQDWRNNNPSEQQKIFNDVLLTDLKTDFDFSKPSLMRIILFRTGENSFQLLWSYHHIIMDGWSYSILIDELMVLYNAFHEGRQLTLKSIPPYQNFIQWLRRQDISKAEIFWREKMDNFTNPTMLANVYKTTQHTTTDDKPYYAQQTLRLSGFESNLIQTFCKQRHFTISTLFNGAWALLVHRYCNESDIVFGVTLSGRSANVDGIESMIGTFINTLPVRIKLFPQEFLIAWLTKLQQYFVEIQEYDYTPLTKIHEWSKIPLGMPLFDSIVVAENYPRKTQQSDNNKDQEVELPYTPERTSYPLTVMVDLQSTISIQTSFHSQIFDQHFINRMIKHFSFLVNQIIRNPDDKLADVEIVPEDEKQQLLFEFNATAALYPKQKLIQDVFEEQVLRVPNNIALTFKDKELTYSELNQKANQLARRLRQKGIGQGSIVGIMLERSMDMIIAILGILKAGGVYLPIDPFYPVDRIKYILDDSETHILVIQSDINVESLGFHGEIIDIADMDDCYDNNNPERINNSNDVAYIIYTSGSTGKPKGVMIEHFHVIRLLLNDKSLFDFTEKDVWTMFHSYCFDFSVWEMYGPLLFGGRLVIVPKSATIDWKEFRNILKNEMVTVLNQTPTAFNCLAMEEMDHLENDLSLRYVIFGGEAFKPAILSNWKLKYPDTKVINMYGITEITVHTTFKEITQHEIEIDQSNIGKPIPTTAVYIMDSNRKLSPVGIVGEIYVAGDGVARGYTNRPELTDERFIHNPYQDGERLYKSGDLARWLPNGEMEFVGRADYQIKIRGFRVELGEIEDCLRHHENIREAAVIDKADQQNNRFLCAYFVATRELTVQELRNYLSSMLPDYMIPASFVQMEKLPLTLNGKLDRKALPDPESNLQTGNEYVAPVSDIEKRMVSIWQMVLHKEQIGVNDPFFDLGGDSILLIQLYALIDKEFPGSLTIVDLFKLATIRKLAAFIEEKAGRSEIKIELATVPVGTEYIHDGEKDQEKYAFEAEIAGENFEVLSNIARNEGIALDDILLGAYFYLLGEISGQKEITIQTVTNQDQVLSLGIQLQNVEDFLSLFQAINRKRNSTTQAALYPIEELSKSRFPKDKDSIIPLFSHRQISSSNRNLFEIFDVVIQAITETDRLYVIGDYNSERLKAKPMRDFFKTWLGLLNVIINQDV